MKNLLIDYLCKWFNLQRKPKEHAFYCNYFGAQSLIAECGSCITIFNKKEMEKQQLNGDRMYKVLYTVKLLG